MRKVFKIFSIISFCFVINACVLDLERESKNGYLDSYAVTSKIKSNLNQQLGQKAALIQVQAYHDEVQLVGTVESAIVRKKAAEIAASVSSVKFVRNNLIVR